MTSPPFAATEIPPDFLGATRPVSHPGDWARDNDFDGENLDPSAFTPHGDTLQVAALLPAPEEGALLAGRYQLGKRIGGGSHGDVRLGIDKLTGAHVAVKLLRHGTSKAAAARACREVAALRLLRMPGIVRLLDEGIEHDQPFLVMERIKGTSFPGTRVPCTWEELKIPFLRFLDTLGRVHAAGFIHRDLKPENVLVRRSGEPVILDFGIARASSGFARITGTGSIVGTAGFIAPEQAMDEAVTARTDLYAAGVMAFYALTGRIPHEAPTILALLHARMTEPAPKIRTFVPSLPQAVAAVLDRLLARDPESRPRSAAKTVALLRGIQPPTSGIPSLSGASILATDVLASLDAGEGSGSAEQSALSETTMRDWFCGPDRILHLREDAARLLWARTEGIPWRVRAELEAWLNMGLARWNGDKIAMDRAAIEQLHLDGFAQSLSRALSEEQGASAEEIATEALGSGRRLLAKGAIGPAGAHFREGLYALRRAPEPNVPLIAETLTALVETAFAEGSSQGLDRAVYELCRPGPTAEIAEPLTLLCRAALAIDTWTERASLLVESVPRMGDPRLERLRQGVRAQSARHISAERQAEVLAEIGEWAETTDDPLVRASYSHWLGRLRYRQNRYAEAARLNDEAARLCDWPPLRIAALFSAGASYLESFDLAVGAERAEAARSLAEASRATFFELQAACLLRVFAYRSGEADSEEPDLALVDVAPKLGTAYWDGAVSLTEACVAMRRNDKRTARILAVRAHRAFTEAAHPIGLVLARGLLLHIGAPLSHESTDDLIVRAKECFVPTVGLQCLAFVKSAGVHVELSPDEIDAMARTIPPEHRSQRLDILSVDEALAMLR